MTNLEKRLFNISNEIEKMLFDVYYITNFKKEFSWNEIQINTGRKILDWMFLEKFTEFTKKKDVNFDIFYNIEAESLIIKLWN